MENDNVFDIDFLRKERMAKLNARQHWLDLAQACGREIQILTETIQVAEAMFEPYVRDMPVDYVDQYGSY
jgi:hypothetical protein